jgi:2-keto-myo-inositol isomerase
MVVDTFHFYTGQSSLKDLREIDKNNLYIFHINDAENIPKHQLTDADRLYPGLGVIPLNDILEKLFLTGYEKMISIELFRPEYWDMEPKQVTKEAKQRTENVLKQTSYHRRSNEI